VVEESLRFCLDLATQDTALAGCSLDVELLPATFFCQQCREEFHPREAWRLICPTCQSPSADLRSGREFLIHSVEIADSVGETIFAVQGGI
jgi:hydrogenase nickel incorporation protein HypA/HybF